MIHRSFSDRPRFGQFTKIPLSHFFLVAALSLGSLAGTSHAQTTGAQLSSALNIEPMTQVNTKDHTGYFGDPYPIHLAPRLMPFLPQYFSGTTQATLQCQRPIRPGCFTASPITVTPSDELTDSATAAGSVFSDRINDNIYQTLDGRWEMAVTYYVYREADPKTHWTVILHARPEGGTPLAPPTTWTADKLLVGSLAEKAYANYDGKYLEDKGRLYLIYSKRLDYTEAGHDGIVAQEMTSPTQLAGCPTVTLLGPSTVDGGLNSEYFHTAPAPNDKFKLIETGNIIRISGKYVLAYSTGDFQQKDYKTGLAYSDTLLPADGGEYRRVLQDDPTGIWGQPDHLEVRYLLQSQKPDWPNYMAAQVIAPGVPSIVHEPGGKYFLYFDGFLPGDAPLVSSHNPFNIEAKHRRPFYLKLNVEIPYNDSVDTATEAELATWITPRAKGDSTNR